MDSRLFSEVLASAIAGDNDAVEALLLRYMPLINRQSVIDGVLDEDLRQYILMRVTEQIERFAI
jgi:hypothetical protein